MEEIGKVKEQNEKLQSTVEQQRKETEHFKVCVSYILSIIRIVKMQLRY